MRGTIDTELQGLAPTDIQPTVRPGAVQYIAPALLDSTTVGLARLHKTLMNVADAGIQVYKGEEKRNIERGELLAEQNAAKGTQEILEQENVSSWASGWVSIGIGNVKGRREAQDVVQKMLLDLPGSIKGDDTPEGILENFEEQFGAFTDGRKNASRLDKLPARATKAYLESANEYYSSARESIGLKASSLIAAARRSEFDIETTGRVGQVLTGNDGPMAEGLQALASDLQESGAAWGMPRKEIATSISNALVAQLSSENLTAQQLYAVSQLVNHEPYSTDPATGGIVVSPDSDIFRDAASLKAVNTAIDSAEDTIARAIRDKDQVAAALKAKNKTILDGEVSEAMKANPRLTNEEQVAFRARYVELGFPASTLDNALERRTNDLSPRHLEDISKGISRGEYTYDTLDIDAGLYSSTSYNDVNTLIGDHHKLLKTVKTNASFKNQLELLADVMEAGIVQTSDGGIIVNVSTILDPAKAQAAQVLINRQATELMSYVRTARDVNVLRGQDAQRQAANFAKVTAAAIKAWEDYGKIRSTEGDNGAGVRERKRKLNSFRDPSGAQWIEPVAPTRVGGGTGGSSSSAPFR